ncbi:MAG: hypothetical protein Q8R69_00580 [Telluria sp.]|nr:hypothetical protein [Telluria sp.]
MGSIPASRTNIRKKKGLESNLQAFFLFIGERSEAAWFCAISNFSNGSAGTAGLAK